MEQGDVFMGGEMTLTDLTSKVKKRVQLARKIEYAVKSEWFRDLYVSTTTEIKGQFNKAILDLDYDQLRVLIQKLKQDDLYTCGIRKLRERAAKLIIPNYSRLTKAQLISEIEYYERQAKALVRGVDKGLETLSAESKDS